MTARTKTKVTPKYKTKDRVKNRAAPQNHGESKEPERRHSYCINW